MGKAAKRSWEGAAKKAPIDPLLRSKGSRSSNFLINEDEY